MPHVTLEQWIKEVGVENVSKILRVTPRAVLYWQKGSGLPTTRNMLKISKLTKGRVSLELTILARSLPRKGRR